jgi:hypothetical protein
LIEEFLGPTRRRSLYGKSITGKGSATSPTDPEKIMIKRPLGLALVASLLLVLLGCGGGGGGGAPATGNVAVVLTDGPTDQYQRILISLTGIRLIGSGGQVDTYDGPEITFDLLEMSDWADLAFNTKVLAGDYSKIRLFVTQIELVDLVNNESVVLDKLPANGKIDLNPRGPFEVSPDYTTVIKLDIDAKRSFQVVQTGNGGLRFRPVIFVDIFQGDIFLPDRLVRVFGEVDADSVEGSGTTDPADDSFRLCDLQLISQSNGPSIGGPDQCVRVYANGSTGVFDELGEEASFGDIGPGELLTAIGFIVDTDDPDAFLGLDSVALEIGDRQPSAVDGWTTAQGLVTSDPVSCDTDQCFDFLPDNNDPVITTRMQPATRVFRADGVELDQADVRDGDTASLDAIPVGDELNAALVVLSTAPGSGIVAGTLDDVRDNAPFTVLDVMTDIGGLVFVCVDQDSDMVQVLVDNQTVTVFDLLDPTILEIGSTVEAYGDADSPPSGCDFVAAQVIVEPPTTP